MASKSTQLARDILKSWKGFDRHLQTVKILSVENDTCKAEVKVEKEHVNQYQNLHGGFSSALIDVISGLALLTHKDAFNATLNMDVSFFKSASIGDELTIIANTLRKGKNLVFLDIEITNKTTKELLVKASQSMFVLKKT